MAETGNGRSGIMANQQFEVDGVRFITGFLPRPDVFTLVKHDGMLQKYAEVLATEDHPRIVEIGLAYGASAAWLALVAEPTVLVGLELSTDPLDLLDALIRDRDLSERVHIHLGVDQGDRDAVRALVGDALRGAPLDLVIDDASHRFGPTLASFEVLFPLLRPGGRYIIEDWKGEDELAHAVRLMAADPTHPDHDKVQHHVGPDGTVRAPDHDPCSRLALELCLARTETTGIVESVTVEDNWIVCERGTALLDPERFRVDDLVANFFGLLRDRRPLPAP